MRRNGCGFINLHKSSTEFDAKCNISVFTCTACMGKIFKGSDHLKIDIDLDTCS